MLVKVSDEMAFNASMLASAGTQQISALNFQASWAEPCKQMNVVFAALSESHPSVNFYSIDAGIFSFKLLITR
jgi:thiol-disulfide isomerase/thioredoxin